MWERLFKEFVGMFLVLFGVEVIVVQRMKDKDGGVADDGED